MKNYSTYSDLNENPTSDRDIILKDEHAIYQAIDNLMDIVKGERLFSNRGIDPEAELFELGGDDDAEDLFNDLLHEISTGEPRIKLNLTKSHISPDYENNKYVLYLYFSILGISTNEFKYIRSV